MKKIIFTFVLLVAVAIQSHAVLKERDLSHTLHVLRLELYNKWMTQKENIKMLEASREQQHQALIENMKRSEMTSLILYSQGDNYTFDMAFACQEATTLYREMKGASIIPFDKIKVAINNEITRYDSLIYSLEQLPPIKGKAKEDLIARIKANPDLFKDFNGNEEDFEKHKPFELDKQSLEDRDICILYAQTLRDNLKIVLERLENDNEHYINMLSRVEKMNNFAQKKYTSLQQSIFINPGSNYFKTLKSIPYLWIRMKSDFKAKYKPLEEKKSDGEFHVYKSGWRGPIVMFASVFMLVYIFGASILSFLIIRFLVPKKYNTESFKKKRPVFIIALAILLFAIAVTIARSFMSYQHLLIMASGLMIEMAWLIEAVFVSLLFRLNSENIKDGARIYTPFILMSVVIICFRISLIPNTLVNIILPPILLIFTIWQFVINNKCRKSLPTSDKIYCFISLITMVVSCIMAWSGYTLMAVQIMVWWMFQLAAIATITCCYDIMEMYENKILEKRIKKAYGDRVSDNEVIFRMKRGDFVDKTWLYDFVNRALVPVCAVYSILLSVFMAAEIFDLRDLCFKWFMYQITIPGIMTISANKLCFIGALFFLFKYVNYLIRSVWFRYRREKGNKNFNATLSRNIIGLCTWGLYAVVAFLMLDVPSEGITYLGTGLTAGLGFASKSLLENFFYGISLMSGRVRVGDYIECDGIIGKVESITYQSTQIITLDGSVVAILNSDLFSKNFKNLTKNHQYELVKIPFGIAYGTEVNKVRSLILENMKSLCKKTVDGRDIINPSRPLSVAFSDFGASSVDLFLVAWVLVDQRIQFCADAKEKIYQVLNENNIEIPFPQQDIYIRSIAKTE